MSEPEVYRTESGTIFRITRSDEGRPSVELLKSSAWESGPVGMAGLRHSDTTTKLTKRQIEALSR
jgi:hypothetical protein